MIEDIDILQVIFDSLPPSIKRWSSIVESNSHVEIRLICNSKSRVFMVMIIDDYITISSFSGGVVFKVLIVNPDMLEKINTAVLIL